MPKRSVLRWPVTTTAALLALLLATATAADASTVQVYQSPSGPAVAYAAASGETNRVSFDGVEGWP